MSSKEKAPVNVPAEVAKTVANAANNERKRIARFIAWYRAARPAYKSIVIAGAVFIVLIIAWIALFGYLTYQSLVGDDLAVFISANHDTIALPHGQTTDIGFRYGANNLLFCEATCDWSIIDSGSGEMIANGSDTISTTIQKDHSVSITAPASGLSQHVYQYTAVCVNKKKALCQTSGETRYAVDTTVVNFTYTPAEQAAANDLATLLPSWAQSYSEALSKVNSIINETLAATSVRYANVNLQAQADAQTITANEVALNSLLALDDVFAARSIIDEPFAHGAIDNYQAQQDLEAKTIARIVSLNDTISTASAILRVASPSDALLLRQRIGAVTSKVNNFSNESLDTINLALDDYESTFNSLSNNYNQNIIDNAGEAQNIIFAEQTAACTIKTATCPVSQTTPSNISDAISILTQSCSVLSSLPTYFAQVNNDYAQTLMPGSNLSDIETAYDVPSIRADPNFATFEANVIAAAQTGSLITTNESERLAVQLTVNGSTQSFIAANCAPINVSLPSAPTPVFNELSPQPITSPSLNLASPVCCSNNVCNVCELSNRYPVVFVHGHSLAASSSPEYNMNAFTAMAYYLQGNGAIYAGHVFPQENLSSVSANEFASVPGPVFFTATYYYNSYPEKGSISLIPQKSEPIEVYSLRLREAIDVVKNKTGSNKVVIVAHSMGGLVARRYIQIFGDDDVAALILIGTPNAGITGTTDTFCSIIGSSNECADMQAGSVFLAKLNGGAQPTIPVHTIAGQGCSGSEPNDGVVTVASVNLPFAQTNNVYNGSCQGTLTLHSALLDPTMHPEVTAEVAKYIDEYTIKN